MPSNSNQATGFTHEKVETNNLLMIVLILLVVAIGGAVEIVPLFFQKSTTEPIKGLKPYTALQLAGRDVYQREGCYGCHSQMIRTLKDEVDRYGPYSLAVESQYDHPMQWGSKRTGPDLARIGGKYSNQWHVAHLLNPRDVVASSIMPRYGWLADNELKVEDLGEHLAAQSTVGVPYSKEQIANATADALAQAQPEADTAGLIERYGKATRVAAFDGNARTVTEMDALVAYLQVLGRLTDKAYEQQQLAGR